MLLPVPLFERNSRRALQFDHKKKTDNKNRRYKVTSEFRVLIFYKLEKLNFVGVVQCSVV